MIELDTSVVNVALPSIRADLKFSDTALVWVVNAYMLAFGGFLLLGGCMGDRYGHRRLFLAGIALFSIASLACGLASTREVLVTARALQGLGGAVVLAVSFALITSIFTDDAERAKATGVFSFVSAGGGSLGLVLGGSLTQALSWHWNFLVNVPIGILVCLFSTALLPGDQVQVAKGRLDVWGAITVTASLMLAIYAIVNGNQTGWATSETLSLLACAVVLLLAFFAIESRVAKPLIPLGVFKLRNLAIANTASVLWNAGMWAWSFISALYMQLVLKYTALQVGLTFLPGNLMAAVLSLGLSAKLVMRWGIRKPLGTGILLCAVALALLARAPVDGNLITDVLPSMLLFGIGAGVAYNPLLLAAMSDAAPGESGLASGIFNTASILGGAFGLAVLASLAASRTSHVISSGVAAPSALTAGYHAAFILGAACCATAALLATRLLRTRDY
jgi:EmrB/QacA subfamily drug resistance transporter